MKAKRIRTGKKKGRDDVDEFQSITQRAIGYLQANMKQTYIALGALAVVVVLTVLVSSLFEQSKQKLEIKQAEALAYYDMEAAVPGGEPMGALDRFRKARGLFEEIVNEQGSGPAADEARYYLANTDMELGDMDSAIAGYVKLVGETSDPMMRALANHRLAAAYLAMGDKEKAMSAYTDIANAKPGYLADEAHFHIGELYEEAGKTNEAIMEYRAVGETAPGSPWLADAKARITALGGDEAPEAKMQPQPGGEADGAAEAAPEQAQEKKAE